MKLPFRGTCTALATPFDDRGLAFDVLDRLLDRQLEAGIEAIVLAGTTGEAATLTKEEYVALLNRAVRRVDGRVKVLAGTGGADTAAAAQQARTAEALGADGLLCVTPYYNRCTQEGLRRHYETLAGATALPIVLYNVPTRTSVDLAPETCAALAAVPNICGVKEASPDIARVLRLRRLCGPDFGIYCGNDDRLVPALAAGADGVVSVWSNVRPKAVKALVDAALAGDFSTALARQLEAQPLIDALFAEVNPIPVKAALELLGFPVGAPRLPLTSATEETRARLRALLSGE